MKKDSVQIITTHYGKLTDSEKKVADYIVTHLSDAVRMSVQEIASVSGVSAATPVRLAKHMGFEGFSELKLYIASHASAEEDIILDMTSSSDSVTQAVEKALIAETESIKMTLKELECNKLTLVSEKLKEAEKILFFGCGSSQLVCLDASHKYERVGKNVFCTDDAYKAAVLLSNFTEKDVVICVSHSGETKSVCKILEIALQSGIFSVCVTTFPGSSVCKSAKLIIYTQTRESPLHKIALTSRISQLATMDALFMTYFTLNQNECLKKLDMVSDNLKKL